MEGNNFVLLFLTLFFMVFALKSLSIPKGTGILVRIGSMFGLWSQPSPPSPSHSFFWPVLIAIVLVIIVYGSVSASSMNSSRKTKDGTLDMLAILLVVVGMISLYNLFTPKATAAPSESTGFSPSIFWVVLIIAIVLVIIVYGSLNASSKKSSMKMEDGTVVMLSFLMIFAGIFALHYMFTPKSTPSPKSIGFSPSFFWPVLIAIVLVIIVYGSFNASSMKMDDGTVVMLSVLMVFVGVLALHWLFTPKPTPPPPPPPPKSTGFPTSIFSGIFLSPFFWVAGMIIFLVISNGGC